MRCYFFFHFQKITEKSTPLVITPNQFKSMDVIKKVLGTSPSVLMTRQQLLNLADLAYRSLRVMEFFRAAEYEFAEEFIKLITRNESFTLTPFDKAVKSMSRFSIDPKFNVETLNKQLSDTFKIEKVGEMSVIKVNGKVSKPLATIVGLKSARSIRDYQQDWIEAKRQLDAQVYDVNYWASSEVEWKIEGEKIVPKSIALAKINKSVFQNAFKFSTINKTITKAEFSKIIKLDANV